MRVYLTVLINVTVGLSVPAYSAYVPYFGFVTCIDSSIIRRMRPLVLCVHERELEMMA